MNEAKRDIARAERNIKLALAGLSALVFAVAIALGIGAEDQKPIIVAMAVLAVVALMFMFVCLKQAFGIRTARNEYEEK